MKPSALFSVAFNLLLILAACLTLTFSAAGQEIHHRDPDNPGKGHWQLFTDAATRNTSIKFFDARHHLLYEEVIPGKYIKLTDRNINRINQTFDLVTRKDLVMSQVKAIPLPSLADRGLSYRRNKHRYPHQASFSAADNTGSRIKLNTFKVLNTTKFYLAFENPDRERLKIYVMNDTKQILHEEHVNRTNYNRRFDFTGLHPGEYLLVVTTVNRKFRYTEQVVIGPATRSWQVEPPIPAFITRGE